MKLKNRNKIFQHLTVFVIVFFNSIILLGQQVVQENTPSAEIVMLSRVKKEGEILLRWGVTNQLAWRRLNKYGYELKRYTIVKDGTILPIPIEKDLGVFKPKPLDDWITAIQVNDNAAIMAQSLYGEGFNVEGEDSLSAIINLSEEQQQRFTWAFYVADQDFKVAQMAGLAYVDSDIVANEMYAYKMFSLVPKEEVIIQEGMVYTGLKDYEDLPIPLDLTVVFKNSLAMLSWNYKINKETYNSYFIERSEDGVNFKSLNSSPLTGLNNGPQKEPERMFYLDSIHNNTKYLYRIKGRTPFGELGPASNVVSGEGKKVLAYVPHITTKKYINDNSIVIGWEFLKEGNQFIKGFEINRSDKVDGVYKTVIKDIAPDKREIQFDEMQVTNYMTVTALGKEGNKRTSLPVLIQPVDSIPPIKPLNLEGKVDSLGVVTLKWKPNAEIDMLGYRIFRGNNKKEEYSQITISPHKGNVYYDSISVKNLNSKVFYKVIAVDKRFNMSKPSDILTLKKPDFIKPTQPVFKSYEIKENKVNLLWINSSSDDVVKHNVYRKSKENEVWQLAHQVLTKENDTSSETSSWVDENVNQQGQYSYTVVAVDDSELESDPALPLTVIVPKTGLVEGIKRLGSFVDKESKYIELFWKRYEEENVAEITIYKGVKDKPISLFKNVLPKTKRIIDAKVKPNNEYVYILRVVFKDGSMSKTATINVKF